jgi:hypothetical protein
MNRGDFAIFVALYNSRDSSTKFPTPLAFLSIDPEYVLYILFYYIFLYKIWQYGLKFRICSVWYAIYIFHKLRESFELFYSVCETPKTVCIS